jgi:hypothetical protein
MKRRAFALVLFGLAAAGCDSRLEGGLVGVQRPGTHLVFQAQPTTVQVGAAITPVVQVAVHNDDAQVVSGSTAEITISIVPGTGTAGALLTGGEPQAASNGIVNFGNLRINTAGSGYQLLASSPGMASVASTPFTVNP